MNDTTIDLSRQSIFKECDPTAYKKFRYNLMGLSTQFEYLDLISKKIFNSHETQRRSNANLNEIKEKIKLLLAAFPKMEPKRYIEDLNEIKNECKKTINLFTNEKSSEYTSENIQPKDGFIIKRFPINNIISFSYSNEEKQTSYLIKEEKGIASDLFKEVKEKLACEKVKIDLMHTLKNESENRLEDSLALLLFRVKNLLPNVAIFNALNHSQEKDSKRINKFHALKNTWFDALHTSREAEFYAFNNYIEKEFTNKIASYYHILNQNKIHFSQINSKLGNLNPAKLCTYNLNKNLIKELIKSYNIFSSQFRNQQQVMTQLTKKMIKFEKKVNDLLDEIDKKIGCITTTWDEEDCCFIEEELKSKLKKQKTNSLENLNKQKNKIIEQWDTFYLDVIKLRHMINILSKFKHITEKMATCYILCTVINQDFSEMPYEKNELKNFEHLFHEKSNQFTRVIDLILQTNKHNMSNNINLLDIKTENLNSGLGSSTLISNHHEKGKIENNNDLPFYDENSKLIDEINDIKAITDGIVHDSNISLGIYESEIVGLKGDAELVRKKYIIQKSELIDVLKNYKEDTLKAFNKTLPEICKTTAEILNIRAADFMPSEKEVPKQTHSWWSYLGYSNNEEKNSSFMKFISPFDKL